MEFLLLMEEWYAWRMGGRKSRTFGNLGAVLLAHHERLGVLAPIFSSGLGKNSLKVFGLRQHVGGPVPDVNCTVEYIERLSASRDCNLCHHRFPYFFERDLIGGIGLM
jgi:hypothetical protein